MRKNALHARNTLIKILSDGQFHSGQSLGQHMSVSRSAVANHVKYLSTLGLDIFSVKGRGYKLAQPLDMLDSNYLKENITALAPEHIQVMSIIGSTNDEIKSQLATLPKGYTCFAEAQTKGRGRRGKTWVSPFGASLYMSIAWHFSGGYQSIAGLSLVVGLALKKALDELGIEGTQLKWPNDLYHSNKKLAGILVEVEGQVGSDAQAVIGLGLNIDLPAKLEGIDQAYIDLQNISSEKINRNKLAAHVTNSIHAALAQFETAGLAPFIEDWLAADLFLNQTVKLISGRHQVVGINKGINESGAILLEQDGKITAHHGGEISVRAC